MGQTIALRGLLWLCFFAVILAAWAVMFAMARDMGLDVFGRMPSMDMPMSGGMAPMPDMAMRSFSVLAPMWAIMMAAMMLPTLVPTLRAYDDLMVSANGSRAGWLGVVGGYLAVWVVFALGLAAAQVALMEAGVLDSMGAATSGLLAGGLLIVAGVWQFTRIKAICHGVCHAPGVYFLGHWRAGGLGGLRMGLALGAYCLGCCWTIMLLGFAGGVMSFFWMGLATLFMVIEKLPQVAHHVTRPAGALLILAGGAVCLAASGVF